MSRYPKTKRSGRWARRKAVFQQIYGPLLAAGLQDGEFIIPETPEFTALCRKLGVNPFEISSDLEQIFGKMRQIVDTAFAANYLKLRRAQVRRLARLGLLPGEKKSGQWQFLARDLRRL